MKVGDFVWNVWDSSILRFGTITARKRQDPDGYAYYTVEWHDDSQYEASAIRDDEARRKKKWYRIDELHPCETYHLERCTYLHRKSFMSEWNKPADTTINPYDFPDDPGGRQDDKFNF
tara:strand:+ start:116 stop:469 length:354 start_codon:yes stop_codon:yes gene_type:complete